MTDYSHIIYFSGVHQATQVFDCWYCSHGKYGGCGGPQADGGVERKLSGINRELKEMGPHADEVRIQVSINDDWLFTHYMFSAVFIKLRKWLMIDDWLLIIDCLHTENAEDTEDD